MLLDRGFNPNASTRLFQTPLVSAVRCGERMVRLLLEAGADVNSRWQDESQVGHTALMKAATLSAVEVVALLLENGADVNATSILYAIPTRRKTAASAVPFVPQLRAVISHGCSAGE